MPEVFVIGRFPPPLDGQTLATRRLAELLEASHQVHRINTSPPDSEYVAAEVKLRPRRVRHYVGMRGQLRRSLAMVRHAPVLWTSVSPTSLGHWRDVLTVTHAFQPGQPVFAVVHRATFERLFQSALTRTTAQRLVERVTGFVFLDQRLAAACADWIPAPKRFVVPNTIEDQVLCHPDEVVAKQADRRRGGEIRLLFLSSMMPEKGYRDVLEALRLLQARSVAFRAVFAGGWVTDADRAAFERFVHKHRLGEVVEHLGPVRDRDQIKKLHVGADVFLLPSYHPTEAQPISIIEALNAGTPIITTRHGGLPEMVREGLEGYFVPPKHPEAIADAVIRLRDFETWMQLSQGARQRFETSYSPERVRQEWLALIQ